MKQWFSIVAFCMVAVILFSSVQQFHHHDGEGRIVLFDCHDDDFVDTDDDAASHHGRNCPCHHGNSTADGGDCCPLKLSLQNAPRHHITIGNLELCFSLLFIGILNHAIHSMGAGISSVEALFVAHSLGIPRLFACGTGGLRAPPAAII